MTRLQKQDLILGLTLLIISLLGLFVVIPVGISSPGDIEHIALSPSFWPSIVMGGLALCGALVCLQSLLSRSRPQQPLRCPHKAEDQAATEYLPTPTALRNGGFVVSLLFLYYGTIDDIGIVIASITLLVILMLLGGERRIRVIAPVAILLPVLLYYFFVYVANIPLPLGMFESWR